MNNNLLILGAGRHGHFVKEVAHAVGLYDQIDFLDDYSSEAIGNPSDIHKLTEKYSYAIPAFSDGMLRLKWHDELLKHGYRIPTLIHPTAFVSPSATIDSGTVVFPKAIINMGVKVERVCILNAGIIVDHDSYIGFGSHIDSGAIIKPRTHISPGSKLVVLNNTVEQDHIHKSGYLKSNGFTYTRK